MTSLKQEVNSLLESPDFRQNPWSFLTEELNLWGKEGVIADFWWRDDDVTTNGPQLQRLLSFAEETSMSLAVIPAKLQEDLAPLLKVQNNINVVQHGYAHINHAPTSEKKAEFRNHRDTQILRQEISEGHQILNDAFGYQFMAMFVPPWNRMSDESISLLKDIGLDFLSTFTPRNLLDGPFILNTHIDPVHWKNGAVFLGEAETLAQAIGHLRAKRGVYKNIDVIEPSGFLTHHAIHDEETWAFIAKFNSFIQNHPDSRWLGLPEYIATFTFDF